MVAHLKNPGMYTSGSAFAPIANPVAVSEDRKVSDVNISISATLFEKSVRDLSSSLPPA